MAYYSFIIYMLCSKLWNNNNNYYYYNICLRRSRNSSAGVAMGYGLDGRGSIPDRCKSVQTGCGPIQPPVRWVSEALSLGIKWPRREADHLCLVSRSSVVEQYSQSPCLYAIVLNELSRRKTLPVYTCLLKFGEQTETQLQVILKKPHSLYFSCYLH